MWRPTNPWVAVQFLHNGRASLHNVCAFDIPAVDDDNPQAYMSHIFQHTLRLRVVIIHAYHIRSDWILSLRASDHWFMDHPSSWNIVSKAPSWAALGCIMLRCKWWGYGCRRLLNSDWWFPCPFQRIIAFGDRTSLLPHSLIHVSWNAGTATAKYHTTVRNDQDIIRPKWISVIAGFYSLHLNPCEPRSRSLFIIIPITHHH